MFDSILVALWASGEARVGGAAGWIGTVNGPGFAGVTFGGGGGAFGELGRHRSRRRWSSSRWSTVDGRMV